MKKTKSFLGELYDENKYETSYFPKKNVDGTEKNAITLGKKEDYDDNGKLLAPLNTYIIFLLEDKTETEVQQLMQKWKNSLSSFFSKEYSVPAEPIDNGYAFINKKTKAKMINLVYAPTSANKNLYLLSLSITNH